MTPQPRAHLRHLAPYEWEASVEDVAREAGIAPWQVVRFDLNTTPWPPVAWQRTLAELRDTPLNEYVHPSNEPLRSAIAGWVGVAPEQVVVTNGADEGLYLVAGAFLGPRRRAVLPTPSFAMFQVVTETVGGTLEQLPVDEGWEVPAGPLLQAVTRPGVRVVWLCSPNNPTGRLVDPELVAAVAGRAPDAVVAVDEAYFELAGVTAAPLVERFQNVLILRTFSKAYGLAGLRAGYAFGPAPLVETLDKVRPPQNMNAAAILAALRALEDQAELRRRVEALVAERQRLLGALATRAWEVLPSQANFLLARPPRRALEVSRWLQAAGLVVRSYPDHPRLSDWLRITVRSPDEDDRLLGRLDELRRP